MDVTFRYNNDLDDVEIVAGDTVVDTIGKDVVESWVTAYNKKHGYVERVKVEQELKEEAEATKIEEKSAEEDSEKKADTEGE